MKLVNMSAVILSWTLQPCSGCIHRVQSLHIWKGKLQKIFSLWTLHWLFVQTIGGWGVACLHILCLLFWNLGRFTIIVEHYFFIHNAFKATQARKSRITSIPLNFLWTLNSGPCFLSQSSVKYWWTAFSLHKNGLRFFKSPWSLYTSALCLTAQSDLDTAAVVVKLVVIHY